jgi:hypothetical protein
LHLFRSGTNKHSQVTVPDLPYKMVGGLPGHFCIRKTVEIKRHFKSVTNLAKFKRYTAQNGTLILQNYMLNFIFKIWGPAI